MALDDKFLSLLEQVESPQQLGKMVKKIVELNAIRENKLFELMELGRAAIEEGHAVAKKAHAVTKGAHAVTERAIAVTEKAQIALEAHTRDVRELRAIKAKIKKMMQEGSKDAAELAKVVPDLEH